MTTLDDAMTLWLDVDHLLEKTIDFFSRLVTMELKETTLSNMNLEGEVIYLIIDTI
jgi:hypothetical protein